MIELTSTSVDNGYRLPVSCAYFTGTAGVRLFEGGGEFACPKPAEQIAPDSSGTVADRLVTILGVRKSTIAASMIVIQFDFADEAAA